MSDVIAQLVGRYPQLLLPIEAGISETQEYKSVCLRGEPCDRRLEFITSPLDSFECIHTKAGEVEVLYLAERDDFIHAYRALGYKCEPVEIPASTGAVTLFGINNWEKVRNLKVPLALANKWDYRDRLILLSRGPYSNVSAEKAGIPNNEWLEKSYIIRKYHEITHFISRSLFPDNKEAIRDEIMADMIGLLFAFGKYDTHIARVFLGIEEEQYRDGGRLQNYVPEGKTLEEVIKRANDCIDIFSEYLMKCSSENPFEIIECLEKEKVGVAW